jgi:hypothetical protein
MLVLLEVVLTERALLLATIFSDPLLFAGLLRKNLQLLDEAEYVAAVPKSYGLCTL